MTISLDKHPYTLNEQGTGQYTDLNMAQIVVLPAVAQALAIVIRNGSNNGHIKSAKEANDNHDGKG